MGNIFDTFYLPVFQHISLCYGKLATPLLKHSRILRESEQAGITDGNSVDRLSYHHIARTKGIFLIARKNHTTLLFVIIIFITATIHWPYTSFHSCIIILQDNLFKEIVILVYFYFSQAASVWFFCCCFLKQTKITWIGVPSFSSSFFLLLIAYDISKSMFLFETGRIK